MEIKVADNQQEILERYVNQKLGLTVLMNYQWGVERFSCVKAVNEALQEAGFKKVNKEQAGRIFIMINTSVLDHDFMERVFGEGIQHDYYGEGMDYLKSNKSCLTYFLTVDGILLGVNLDHRGTGTEVETNLTDKQYHTVCKGIMELVAKHDAEKLKHIIQMFKRV